MGPARFLTWAGLLVGGFGVGLQFALSIPAYLSAGRWLPDALITFFTFYTVLSNLALVLVYLSELSATPRLALFRHPLTRAMMVPVMILVTGFYHLLLAALWAPTGLFLLADVILHSVTTPLYLAWWLAAGRHGRLDWRDLPLMLVPTLVYFVWVLARGAIVGQYPYPILAANTLGYAQAALNAAVVAAVLAVLAAAVIAADKALGRRAEMRHG